MPRASKSCRNRRPDRFVATNGHYGYSCACVSGTFDVHAERMTRLEAARVLPLRSARSTKPCPPLGASLIFDFRASGRRRLAIARKIAFKRFDPTKNMPATFLRTVGSSAKSAPAAAETVNLVGSGAIQLMTSLAQRA